MTSRLNNCIKMTKRIRPQAFTQGFVVSTNVLYSRRILSLRTSRNSPYVLLPTRSLLQQYTPLQMLCSATPAQAKNLPPHQEQTPSQETLLAFVKSKAAKGAVRKLVTTIEETENGIGEWGTAQIRPDMSVYQTGIRALLKAGRTDLATHAYRLRMKARSERPDEISADFPLASSVIRAVLRDCKKRNQRQLDSTDIFDDVMGDTQSPEQAVGLASEDPNPARKVSAMLSMMIAFLAAGDTTRTKRCLNAVQHLSSHGKMAAVPVSEYNNAIRLLGKKRYLEGVFAVLDLMRSCGVESNNETFEFLANAAVRQVEFVTGAVSMDTLPEPLGSEVAFVGRSNVGKSSLVNMLCNRKALAYVSGRPGKTQQFNYFLVNGNDKESQFYLVDLPGVGYAKVPRHVQQEWTRFMVQYLTGRNSLRLVFHLVDGRHGAQVDDESLMQLMSESGFRRGEYVIVLTKMDKLDKQKVKQSILDKTRSALIRNGCSPQTPIILTSSSTRLGRDEMWRHLQQALRPVATRKRK